MDMSLSDDLLAHRLGFGCGRLNGAGDKARSLRLVHTALSRPDSLPSMNAEISRLRKAQEQTNRLLMVFAATVAVAVGVAIWALAGQ